MTVDAAGAAVADPTMTLVVGVEEELPSCLVQSCLPCLDEHLSSTWLVAWQ